MEYRTDFQRRAGRWPELSVEKPNGMTLRSAVNVLLRDFDSLDIETTQAVDLRRPTNTSSSPEISGVTFSATI